MDSAAVKEYLLELQELIVERLEQVDGKKFLRDKWERATGSGGIGKGEGISCLIEEGNVLERGGVAFSHVQGDKMPASATAHRPELAGCSWEAMGVSLVMHPRNPYAPTSHCQRAHVHGAQTRRRKSILVRRRHGPHPLLRLRGRRGALPPDLQELAGTVRSVAASAFQEMVRRLFLPQASQRTARHGRHLLRRSERAGF